MASSNVQTHAITNSGTATSTLTLKGGMTAHVLLQLAADATFDDAHRELQAMLADDAESLQYSPCLLAFPGRDTLPPWLPDWVALLRQHTLVPFAVQCTGDANRDAVNALGLADLPVPEPSFRKPRSAPAPVRQCQVVRQQVRSGQQIYARDADLVILASVSAGAEVMADHDIHIYGDLRGRALAGVKGQSDANIFCQTLDAELVAIAGVYALPEQFPDERHQAHVHLKEEEIVISTRTEPTSGRKSSARS